jgi:hypothetical protein
MENLQIQFYIDQKVPPVQQPYRRIPVALQEKAGKELENLQKYENHPRVISYASIEKEALS